MQIITEADFSGVDKNHRWAEQFQILNYSQGGASSIPHGFFRNWLDQTENINGKFYIGKCSGFGVGSMVKYDAGLQNLHCGRFVAGGLRLKFLLNGQHEMRTISTAMFSVLGVGLKNAAQPQYADSIIKNDVWIGDEMMMLGGGIIENGCVIGARALLPPNFRSEPYGIYAGTPAKLIRFRFSEKVREALLNLAWWEMPLTWIRDNNDAFLQDLTVDELRALEMLAKLLESKKSFMQKNSQTK
jgi:acetyltransferase-like isoleucine patch superfamily enzyme